MLAKVNNDEWHNRVVVSADEEYSHNEGAHEEPRQERDQLGKSRRRKAAESLAHEDLSHCGAQVEPIGGSDNREDEEKIIKLIPLVTTGAPHPCFARLTGCRHDFSFVGVH